MSAHTNVSVEIRRLKDKDPNARMAAVRALGMIGPKAKGTVPALIVALRDEDDSVRGAAEDALGNFGSDAVPALVRELKDRNTPVVHRAATEALGRIGIPAIHELLEISNGESEDARNHAAVAFRRIGVDGVPTLKAALGEQDRDVRKSAAWALGQIGPEAKGAVPALIEALNDEESQEVRHEAAEALGRIGLDAQLASPRLINALKDERGAVREAAALALGNVRPEGKTAILALTDALKDNNEFVRRAAAAALGKISLYPKTAVPALIEALRDENEDTSRNAAKALAKIAVALQDTHSTEMIEDLSRARDALQANSSSKMIEETRTVQRAIESLELVKQESFKQKLHRWIYEHPGTALGIGLYLLLLVVWFALLGKRPLGLLRINEALKPYTDFKLPAIFGGMQLPVRYALLVGFFHYHRRILDAWVSKYIDSAREKFEENDTVRNRGVHIPIPVILNGRLVPSLNAEQLKPSIAKGPGCLLIWGEGGAGKTSLACQVARWAMSEDKSSRLCEHLMLPVLIDYELDFNRGSNRREFHEAVRGQLKSLIGEDEPPSEELVYHLLSRRRLLVIVDGFSERSEATRKRIRPMDSDFPANALVVTSRREEVLGGVLRATVKPLRIQGNRLSTFMEAYLTKRGKRDLFDDAEYFDACRRLSLMVGDRDITVLLAKLYAEEMISSREETSEAKLSENIPDLMLRYLNDLNRGSAAHEPDDRTVHRLAKSIAWECLKQSFRPTPARRDDILAVLGGHRGTEAHLLYLEDRLRLIQTIGAGRDHIRFALDPLAEYLAGLTLVNQFGENEESWREFLAQTDKIPGAPKAIKGFLLAVRDCCLAKDAEAKVPHFVAIELAKRAGLDPEVVKRAQLQQRIRYLISGLTSLEAEDRRTAADALGRMGQEAKAALPILIARLKDADWLVRITAARALGNMGPEAKTAVPALIDALKDMDARIRGSAAHALGGIGPAAIGALPALIEALIDSDEEVRKAAAMGLGKMGPDARGAIPALEISRRDRHRGVQIASEVAIGRIFGKPAK